jgi:superfamily I DNA/RNA helicase
MTFAPTAQQQDFLTALANTTSNIALVARAGCGKTSTILLAVQQEVANNPKIEISVVCYGNAIKTEIAQKLESLNIHRHRCAAATTHSLGFDLVRHAYHLSGPKAVNANKVRDIVRDMAADGSPSCRTYGQQVAKLVSLAKTEAFGFFGDRQVGDRSAWYWLADHYDVNGFDDASDMDDVISAAQTVYKRSLADTSQIDFDDMVLFPLVKNLRVRFPKDLIFVDEAQDTSRARQALIRKFVKPHTGRIVLVGDDRQAIMGFAGADADALTNMIREFDAIELPLSVTWRCPQAVVQEAQTIVRDIQFAPNAKTGTVKRMSVLPDDIKAGEAILCRNTAPLIQIAYSLIRQGKAAKVEGRDIGAGMKALATRWKVVTIDALLNKLEAYQDREVQKAMAKGQDSKVVEIEDRVETVREVCKACLAQGRKNVADVVAFIDVLFTDGEEACVKLATYHRSKGREWGTVYLYEHGTRCPSKGAKQEWQLRQERNLAYVAITRAMDTLVYVG